MSKKITCEYCGQQTDEYVCPFCGGINRSPKSSRKNKATLKKSPSTAPDPTPSAQTNDKHKQLSKKKKILLGSAAFVVICLISYAVTPGNKTRVIENTVDSKAKDEQQTEKNRFFLTQEGSADSAHVLDGNAEEHIKTTSFGKESEIVLPCDYKTISELFNILPVNSFLDNDKNNTEGEKAPATLDPLSKTWLFDSYRVFNFCVYNDSEQKKDLEECVCDSITISDSSKVTSVLFHNKELMQPPSGILDTFGEPTSQLLSEDFYSISYETSCGRLNVVYFKDENGVLDDYPNNITIENCPESRNL